MTKTPSKFTPLRLLRSIQTDNGIAAGGSEYSGEELDALIREKEQRKADALDFDEIVVTPRTREDWLLKATEMLRDGLFKQHEAVIPLVRVSVGFPGGGSARKRIGEYWQGKAVSDGVPQVFISPVLDDAVHALETLAHELIHAVHPTAGHKGPFRKLALAIGLTGKMTSTVAGPELRTHLSGLSDVLGLYPNSAINLAGRKKQGTRLGKVACQDCGYTCRVTRKWIESHGAPLCPCNSEPMEVES